jgi:hypothetical protein
MAAGKKIYKLHFTAPESVDMEVTGFAALAAEHDYYYDILVGRPLPAVIEIDLVRTSRFKRLRDYFISFGGRLIASDRINDRMQALLRAHCHTICLESPMGNYTYYLPKTILDTVDKDETEAVYSREKPKKIMWVHKLVLLEKASYDVPIFKIYPPDYSTATFVNEDFVALYKEGRCRGLDFELIEVSPWWEAYI